jgi:hypothetical protein
MSTKGFYKMVNKETGHTAAHGVWKKDPYLPALFGDERTALAYANRHGFNWEEIALAEVPVSDSLIYFKA